MDLANLKCAFEDVKANRGCAGVDGVTLGQFDRDLDANLFALQRELEQGTYFPLPLMKILVAKKNGEPRGLCIPAVRDRVVQRAVLDRIEPELETQFEACSFAYRKGRSVKMAIGRVVELYNKGYRFVVEADIDAFFDNVDHELLHAKVERAVADPAIRTLIGRWVQGEVWDGKSLEKITRGIPQGSVISPVLANLFLDELDEAMLAQGFAFVRYADDYVVLCKTEEKAVQALDFSKQVLDKLRLELDEEDVTSFDEGFKYLGVFFLRSMVMKPFETQARERKVLYYPPPLDLPSYLLKRHFDRLRA